jgi:hypothetical protein
MGMLTDQLTAAREKVRARLGVVREILAALEKEVARCKANLRVLSYDGVTVMLPSNRTAYTEGILEHERKYQLAVSMRDLAVNATESAVALLRQSMAPRDPELDQWKLTQEWKP